MVELLCVKNKKCFLGEVCRLLHASVASEVGCRWQAARATAAWLGAVLSRRAASPGWTTAAGCPWRTVDVISSLVVVTHSQVFNYLEMEAGLGKERGMGERESGVNSGEREVGRLGCRQERW